MLCIAISYINTKLLDITNKNGDKYLPAFASLIFAQQHFFQLQREPPDLPWNRTSVVFFLICNIPLVSLKLTY